MASHELSGLIRHLGQDDWGACFNEVLEQHLGPALNAAEVSFDDLKEILGPDVVTLPPEMPSH
ncbi:MAG: hypothetical protein ABF719_09675 [Acetobacter sp.]|uniref:hypothetical protein n=1 Tax=Acetobacter sp. TaxID=440 RepID=UPI0039E932FC